MPLLTIEKLSCAYGTQVLLDQVDLQVDRGERIAIVGRNGEGKSTLFRILSGEIRADDGEIHLQNGVVIAKLDQEVPLKAETTVFDAVAAGLAGVGELISRYHSLLAHQGDVDLKALEMVQQQIDACDGWSLQQRVESIMQRLGLPPEKTMAELSGGWRRRVVLARALVQEPDILLLDEPTNHLDIEAIQWLEQSLRDYRGALLFITHDRSFLQALATRIIELDRGHLTNYPGNYQEFLVQRDHNLVVEARHQAEFDKKLAQEEVWIRQGIKARRTRNEGRVRALKALREEFRERRVQQGKARFDVVTAEKSGKQVFDIADLSFSWPHGQPLIEHFSARIMRGDRVGIIGRNGTGKTTLIKLLLGELAPTGGTVTRGTQLQIAYFDQQRNTLEEDKTVIDNVAEGREFITLDGKERHVISFLGDFLFSPLRARTKVSGLSGGERNRALLAKLFSKPANLLVMDEPTNDLDIETLELLEERLLDFNGTLLLVSHDRAFMDNVVTSTIVLSGQGRVEEFVGGYSDWVRLTGGFAAQPTPRSSTDDDSADEVVVPSDTSPPQVIELAKSAPRKLSYKLQRELELLPAEIESLESKKAELEAVIASSDFYQQDHAKVTEVLSHHEKLQTELDAKMERWLALESGEV